MEDAQVEDHLNRVKQLVQSGRFNEAESLGRAILEQRPAETRAWRWLGSIAYMRGDFPSAEQAYRHAAHLEPDNVLNWGGLGCAVSQLGRHADAEACFRRALLLDRSNAANWSNLAGALVGQAKRNAAADAFRQSLAIDDKDVDIWTQLARTESQQSNFTAARSAYERSLSLSPSAEVALEYARLLLKLNELPLATHLLRQITDQSPKWGPAWQAYGDALKRSGDTAGAIAAYRSAVAASPAAEELRYSLAMQLLFAQTTEAKAIFDALLKENPQSARSWIGCGLVALVRGDAAAAVRANQHALQLDPSPKNHSQLLQSLQYCEDVSPEQLLSEHRQWNDRHARPLMPAAPFVPMDQKKHEPLRLGFVSGNFCRGPLAFLVLPTLEHLDRSACRVICYSDGAADDEYTARFRLASDKWHETASLNDEELTAKIRSDKVDVLFDLDGHIGSRLLVFARKAAPVQMSWLGYVGTTGLSSMDYLVADRYHVAAGQEPFYTEQVLGMPCGYVCYEAPRVCPPVSDLPFARTGRFTFGCFNGPQKFSDATFDLWAEVLRRVPAADLFLKYSWLGESDEQNIIRRRFQARGIAPNRIHIEGWSEQPEFLRQYGRVDLALDTLPYSGGLTTCEALWMGVPVITCPGRTFAGRHSTSHLTNAGLPQFVAKDLNGYIDLAINWANSPDELASIRRGLRHQMITSPLCDVWSFARDFLAAIKDATLRHSRN